MDNPREDFRLSPLQERLWLLEQQRPSCYIRGQVQIHGPLDVARLQAAVQSCVSRHAMLRTRFRRRPGFRIPLQAIAARDTATWQWLDLTDQPDRDVQRAAVLAALAQPFAYADEPPLRVTLLTLADSTHELHLSLAALCGDRSSLKLLIAELHQQYLAGDAAGADTLDEEPVEYLQFAEWQREMLEDEAEQSGRDTWRFADPHALPPVALQGRRSLIDPTLFQPQEIAWLIPTEQHTQFQAIAARHGVALEALWLALWQALLWHVTGQSDLVHARLIDGRKFDDFANIVGLFTRWLPLPADIRSDHSLGQAAQLVAARLQELDEYQEYFVWSSPAPSDGAPVLGYPEISFEFVDETAALADSAWRLVEASTQIDRCLLQLSCHAMSEQIRLVLRYDASAIEEAAAAQLARQIEALVASVATQPTTPIAQLSLLDALTRQRVLFDFNQTAADYPRHQSLPALVSAQASKTPAAVAVEYAGQTLTYRELDQRSDRLARRLVGFGVRPDMTIGLCVGPGLELLVGLLAILKAGGAYLPIDPAYPRERIAYLVDDSQTPLILTERTLAERLPAGSAQIIELDALPESALDYLPELSRIDPAQLAYVIYTSGSTGKPKGVMVTHQGLLNYVWWATTAYDIAAGSGTPVHSPISFDLTVTSLLPPLLVGQRVILLPAARGAEALAHLLRERSDLTLVKLTPAHLEALNQVLPDEQLAGRARALVIGGEALAGTTVARWQQHAPATRLINEYGPTETVVGCCVHTLTGTAALDEQVPIGRPIANTELYILDSSLQPVPFGVVGELYIGGDGLARGYLNRPATTAERFVPHPWSHPEGAGPGARLYKTGDLARYRPDGTIEFVGRDDDQIKLRGFRIEPAEIEFVLLKHPAIQRAMIVARAGHQPPLDTRLIGYVVPDAQGGGLVQRLLRLEQNQVFPPHIRFVLPNGLLVAHRDPAETERLYQQIFVDQSHLHDGLMLPADATILDIGAGIGLFGVWSALHYPAARVLACESESLAAERLRINLALYNPGAQLFTGAVGASGMPGTEQHGITDGGPVGEPVDLLPGYQAADLATLIQSQALERIDLLRISATQPALTVLAGLRADDWPKVQHVLIELPQPDVELAPVQALLAQHGFESSLERPSDGHAPAVLYARQHGAAASAAVAPATQPWLRWASPRLLIDDLYRALRQQLPDYMIPSALVVLPDVPLTPNGKLDWERLPAPSDVWQADAPGSVQQRSQVEELVLGIWRTVLGQSQLGPSDNFFTRGGHSLLAAQVIVRVRESFGLEVHPAALFDHPTAVAFAQHLEQALIDSPAQTESPLTPADRSQPLPLSFGQQRLWFLNQLEPDNPFYNIPLVIRLRGRLNIPALEQTLSEIVRRHETLRTTFSTLPGETIAVQVIAPAQPLVLSRTDLRTLPNAERAREVQRLIAAEAEQPFDLQRGPVLRSRLLQIGAAEHLLLITVHHIALDAWSTGVLVDEVGKLYSAYSAGEPSPLPELPLHYADYASWQAQRLAGTWQAQQRYWLNQLKDAPTLLELPTDRPRPPIQTFQGATATFLLPAWLSQSLLSFSQSAGVTLFMTLLAGFQALLYRYSGQRDLLIGTPVANRQRRELEAMIGFFVNTVVLRAQLDERLTFRALVQQTRATTLTALAHQDFPFEKLVEELQPQRDLSRTPIFQVMFQLHNAAVPALQLPDLLVQVQPSDSNTALFDLNVAMEETAAGLSGTLEYSTDLFDPTTIERLIAHFQALLERAVAAPDQPIVQIPLLTSAERQQVLTAWNQTAGAWSGAELVHTMFEDQVRLTPEQIAVIAADEQVSYRDLNQRANQLAAYLRSCGVGPDVPVALCLERSTLMVVALLAVLKAGGAYVPLDPAYPTERLAFMLEDVGRPLLLTQQTLSARLAFYEAQLCVDSMWSQIAAQPDDHHVQQISPHNLAYIIYTSGSTGTPKGVSLSHAALVNLMRWHFATISGGERTLQFASLSFDASFHEICAACCSGGSLVIAPEEVRRDPHALGHFIAQQRIEKMILPVVVLQQLAATTDRPEQLGHLRHVMATGEALQITQPMIQLFSQMPHCRLHNHYGPSETHVVTALTLPESSHTWPALPSIGRPLANTDLYILDQLGQPTPVGVPGLLFIGGAGLARGYHNRPALTAERFVPHPWSAAPGARLYATGDRARYRADGTIEFLGRADEQVKIRGFRVELGEIAALLGQHPDVQEAAVVVREDQPGDKRLVAYIVSQRADQAVSDNVRAFLQSKLPDYMVPLVVRRDALPLTGNGKIHRQALLALQPDRASLELPAVAPRTTAEQVVADCWQAVLHLDRIGVHDNFFALGGHSLLATQVVTRLRDIFQVELPLRSLFESPTVAGTVLELTRLWEGNQEVVEEIAATYQHLAGLSEQEAQAWLAAMQSDEDTDRH